MTTIAAALAELDRLKARNLDIQTRLDTTLSLLRKAGELNEDITRELRHAHNEIIQLENERDTWRAVASA